MDRGRYDLRMRIRSTAGVLLIVAASATAAIDRTQAVLSAPAKMGKESGTPLSEVIYHLRDQSQQNIFMNWRALEAAGVRRTLPITMDLTGLTVGQAAARLTKAISGRELPIGFTVDEGVLTISTEYDLARNVETRTYDVRRWLNPNDAGRAKRVDAMLRRIEGIDPRSWKDNGGDLGSVKEVGGQLIVTTTPSVHDRVAAELADARPAPEARPPDARPNP